MTEAFFLSHKLLKIFVSLFLQKVCFLEKVKYSFK